MTASRRNALLTRSALCGVLGAMAIGGATPALAQATGVGTIVSTGSNGTNPGIGSGGGVTDISLNGSRTFINWNTLNVSTAQSLNFHFDNRGDVVVNRVLSGSASIDGILNGCMATCGDVGGNIWILSAGGVMIGANARINSGGFLATTAGLTDADILDGNNVYNFSGTGGSGISVANGAQITTNGGTLALIAPVVTTAAGSTLTGGGGADVLYGAAEGYTITFAPDANSDLDLVSFSVPAATGTSQTTGLNLGGATSGGRVFASVVSKTAATSQLLLGGTITATNASGADGDIVLSAGGGILAGGAGLATGGTVSTTITGASALSGDGNATLASSGDTTWTAASGSIGAIDVSIVAGDEATVTASNGSVALNSISGVNGVSVSAGGAGNSTSVTTASSSLGDIVIQAAETAVLGTGSAGRDLIVSGASASLGTGTAGRDIFVTGTTGGATVTTSAIAGDDVEITASGAVAAGGATLRSNGLGADDGHVLARSTGSSVSVGAAITQGIAAAAGDITIQAISTATLGSGSSSRDLTVTGVTANLTTGSAARDLFVAAGTGGATVVTSATAGDDVQISATGAGAINAGNATLTSTGVGALDDARVYVATGTGTVNVGNAITQGLGAATGDITIQGGATTVGGASSTGSLAVSALGVLTLTGDLTAQDAVAFNAGGLIVQSGGVITADTLAVNSGGSVSLAQTNAVDTLNASSSAGTFTFRNGGDLDLAGNISAGSGLLLTSSSGAITQSAGILDASSASIAARTGITLGQANTVGSITLSNTVSGGVTYRSAAGISLGLISNFGRAVTLTADSGSITQTNTLTAGTLNASATGAVMLANAGNAITGLGNITTGSGGLTLTTSGNLDLTGAVNTGIQALTLTSGGAITQSSGSVIAGTLNASAETGLALNRTGNDFGAIGTLSNTSGGGVMITDFNNIDVSGGITALGQTITLTAVTGHVEQTGGAIVGGTLVASGTTGIGLGHTGNDVDSLGVMVTTAGGITYNDADGFDLTNNVLASGQTIQFQAVNGAITQSGGVITGLGLVATASGGITLDQANQLTLLGNISAGGDGFSYRDTNSIQLTGAISTPGNVSIASNTGSILQTSGSVTANTLSASAVLGIDFASTSNNVLSLGTLSNSTSGGVSYTDANSFEVGGAVTAAGQTVSLRSVGGGITQALSSAITADVLTATALTGIILTSDNAVTSLGAVNAGSGGFLYRDVDNIALTGNITSGGTVAVFSNAGAISQTGGVISANGLSAQAVNGISFSQANTIGSVGPLTNTGSGDIALYDADGFNITGNITNIGRTVSLDAGGGGITQSVGVIRAGTLTAITVGGLSLTLANEIDALGTINNSNSGGVEINNAQALIVTGNISANPGNLTLTTTSGVLTVNGRIQSNFITLIGADGVAANNTTGSALFGNTGVIVRALNGDALVENATANGFITVEANGDATLRQASLGSVSNGVTVAATGTATLGADSYAGITSGNYINRVGGSGAINVTSTGGDARVFLNATTTGLDLVEAGPAGAASIGVANGFTVGTVRGYNVLLHAPTGTITATTVDVEDGDYTVTGQDFAGAVFAPAGSINNLTITDTGGGLTISAPFSVAGNINISATNGGTLTTLGGLTAGVGGGLGDVTLIGSGITAGAITADRDVVINGGTGIVTASSVSVGRNYTLTGGGLGNGALSPLGARSGTWTLTDTAGNLALGNLSLSYGGDIVMTVSGSLLGTGGVLSTSGGVTIDAGSILLNTIYGDGGAVDLTSAGDITVTTVQAAGGDIDIDAGGYAILTNLAASGSLDVSAAGNLDVGDTRAGDDIRLASTGGALTVRWIEMTGTGAGRDLTLTASGDLRVGAATVASIAASNTYSRAATGTTTVTSNTGNVTINLDSAADLGDIEAGGDAAITVNTGDIYVNSVTAQAGSISVSAVNGDILVGAALSSALDLTLAANSLFIPLIEADRDLTVTTNSSAYIGYASAGDDIRLTSVLDGVRLGGAMLTGAGADTEGDGRNLTISAERYVILGADSEATITADNTLGRGVGAVAGSVSLVSTTADIDVYLESSNATLTTLSGNTVVAVVAAGDLTIGSLTAVDAILRAPETLAVSSAADVSGNYVITAGDFSGLAASPLSGVDDVTITDTSGDLTLNGVITAGRHLTVVVQGGALLGNADLEAGAGADTGDLTVTASAITLNNAAADRDVTLDAGTGMVALLGTGVTVARDYDLTGGVFIGGALTTLGARTGTWTIVNSVDGIDAFGVNFPTGLTYGGSIDITANGLIRGHQITVGTGDITLNGQAVTVDQLSAGNDITVLTTAGDARIGSATAGDDIWVETTGGLAQVRQVNLTGGGSNRDLTITATGGDAIFGFADNIGLSSSETFTRAGSGTANITSTTDDALVNLNFGASLGTVQGAGSATVFYQVGALDVDTVSALGGTASVTAAIGNLTIGDLEATVDGIIDSPVGFVQVNGTVTVGGDLTIVGLDNVILAGDLNVSAGSVEITGGSIIQTGGRIDALTLEATADYGLTLTGLNTIDEVTGLASDSGGIDFRNQTDLEISGDVTAASQIVNLVVNGTIDQTGGVITAGRFTSSSVGGASFGQINRIESVGDLTNTGSGKLFLNTAPVNGTLYIDGLVSSAGQVEIRSHNGLTFTANGRAASAATGDALMVAANGYFENLRGADALTASDPAGRWLLYVQTANDPSGASADFGPLAGKSFYGAAYDFATGTFATTPGAGNRFVYGYRPVLTVTPVTQTVTYDGSIPSITALITGLINGDLAADAWSGSPLLSGNTSKNAGTYNLLAALGTLASEMNYDFDFGTGLLTINPKALTGTVTAGDKTYDGTSTAIGSVSLSGVIGGDDVSASGGTYSFADANAGVGKAVTASGVGLTGADAGNYTLDPLAAAVADILRKALTGTLTASTKTYDGTTTAGGAISLTGVIAGDDVAAGGTYAFANENAGVGKVVTASGVSLSGADAANYDLTAVSTAIADILRKSLTGTLTASTKTYDGTATAAGSVSLTGVIAGDDVAAGGGTITFADRNAGVGKTVTASDVSLSGADAANYDLTAVSTAIADILRKSLTGTLTASTKTYDGTATATGSIGLTGVIAGDDVAAGGTYAFADKNAGAGKTVTATGVGLTGADAGNYDLAAVSTAIADILRKSLTGTVVVQDKTYDGTTAATGSVTLAGVIAGDGVGTTAGTYAFADANAGAGKTITVSGVSLTGADAGNYVLSPLAPSIASILRRAVAIQADDKTKRFGQPDPALTWALVSGSLVQGDAVSGAIARASGEQAGTYVIGQGSLTLSQNYDLTFTPGAFVIEVMPGAGQDASDALRWLRQPRGYDLYDNPSDGLVVVDERGVCPVGESCPQVSERAVGAGAF